jgi:predicted SAM-dependent methyltransferase
MKVNLGCGSHTPAGWVNVDYALGARLTKIPFFKSINKRCKLFNLDWNDMIFLHDLTKKFPWPDSSVDVVYTSHTLEHFNKNDGRRFLTDCHRVLRKDGILRVVVPDLRYIVNDYLDGRVFADDFITKLDVLYGHSDNKLKNKLLPFIQFPHKCMYDASRLVEILNDIGFKCQRKGAFESDIEDIRQIELDLRTRTSLIVEGFKL